MLICYTPFVSRYWPYGSEGCQTHGFHGFVTALSSIHFIAAIAWDRYHQYCTSTLTSASVFEEQLAHNKKQILSTFPPPRSALCTPLHTYTQNMHTYSEQVFVLCLQLILRLAILKRPAGQQVACCLNLPQIVLIIVTEYTIKPTSITTVIRR